MTDAEVREAAERIVVNRPRELLDVLIDACHVARAYLASPPPLAREQVERAVAELFAPASPRHFAEEEITDGLCRLLGVDTEPTKE